MLELFVIFSKGGIVLWWFQGASQLLAAPVNALVKDVLLQGKAGTSLYKHDKLALQYSLDNQFELVFVVAYQAELALSYVDKLLSETQLRFRDMYKNELSNSNLMSNFNFTDEFNQILKRIEHESKILAAQPRAMRKFEDSAKSKKTIASLIVDPNKKVESSQKSAKGKENVVPKSVALRDSEVSTASENEALSNDEENTIEKNRELFMKKLQSKSGSKNGKSVTKPEAPKKKEKVPTKWDLGGTSKDLPNLDIFQASQNQDNVNVSELELSCKGKSKGNLADIEAETDSDDDTVDAKPESSSQTSNSGGFFSMFKNLTLSKALTKESTAPVLEKMREHLIAKNVAADIAEKLCDSVAAKLEGKVLSTFSSVASTVKHTLQESCVQILSPKRRIDILRDAMDAKQRGQPYCITFCGVNGVGKSTNLSKVAFWLIENGLTVLIAACDTFRAGAVEQLRTHTRKLNTIHPPSEHGGKQMVQLFEKGYDKDAASVAMSAIVHARDMKIDVVLVDTAGRMQDNEPLMRSLAKLITINQPDLVLFVGEALVGNEAVDQLVKFNQALADHSQQENPHLIDGIVLTKFDTIDDKVGAAVSMTYITGQPIVFVGTGQTYTDLKTLNARAVVSALMKS